MKHLIATAFGFFFSFLAVAQPGTVSFRNKTFSLSWWDEFSGPRVDSTRWDFRRDSKALSTQLARNNVQQNGILRQFLRKETASGKSFTAGGLISEDTLHYGYYEASIKTPPKKGWHSGFWLMKQDGTGGTGVARASLEIDILENDSENLNSFTCLHRKYNPIANLGIKTFNTSQLNQRFVKVGCLYEPDSIIFYYDGRQVDKRFVGNLISGKVNIWLTCIGYTNPIDESVLPSTFEVDYIRFYELTPPVKAPVTLLPTADARVEDGAQAASNFGSSTLLGTALPSAGNQQESFLRFDLSPLKYYIGSAKLRIFGALQSGNSDPAIVNVQGISGTPNWTEGGINWNNKPASLFLVQDSVTVNGTLGRYYEWDVTSYVVGQKEGSLNNVINLRLSQQAGSSSVVEWLSKESPSNRPELVIKPLEMVPVIESHPKDTIWMKDSVLNYAVQVRGIRNITYQWKKNGVPIPGATSAVLSFPAVQLADSGLYTVLVGYGPGFDVVESRPGRIQIRAINQLPDAQISQPVNGNFYSMGETLALSGNGTDPETGNLRSPDLTWYARYSRNGSWVNTLPIGTGFSPNFTIPITTETTTSVFYRIFLVVRDPLGGRDTTFIDVVPRVVSVHVQAQPSGFQVTVNGTNQNNITQNLIVGSRLNLGVPDPQGSMVFLNWSQGGSQTQVYTVTAAAVQTLTATLSTGLIIARNPTADAFAQGNSGSNFGATNPLVVRFSSTANNIRETYIRFDISNLPGNINNVRLRMYGGLSDAFSPSMLINVREVTGSWAESTLVWSNRPATQSAILASQTVVGTSKVYYEWDLTSFVQAQRDAGRTEVNFQLTSPQDLPSRVDLNSKESSTFRPELRFAMLGTAPTLSQQPQNQSACEGTMATFTSSASGNPAPSVQWQQSLDNGNTWNPIPGATSPTLSVVVPGTNARYSAVWSNAYGSATSDPALMTAFPKPPVSITAGGAVTFCPGGSVSLTASGASTYLWNTGSTSAQIIASDSGWYSVTGTGPNGCTHTAGVRVGHHPLPQVFTLSGQGSYCSVPGIGGIAQLSGSESGVLYEFSLTGGTAPLAQISGSGTILEVDSLIGAGTLYAKATHPGTGCTRNMNGYVSLASVPAQAWYQDQDGDGFGNPDSVKMACSAPSGYLAVAGDCDDQNPLTACYCWPSGMSCDQLGIQSVQVNTLTRSGACQDVRAYQLFPGTGTLTTQMQRGLAYPYQIQGTAPGAGFGIWCDFNEDYDFLDPGEFLLGSSVLGQTFSGQLTIPQEAQAGIKRLRIRMVQGENPGPEDACTVYPGAGETQDFTIEITQPDIIISSAVQNMCAGTDLLVSFTTAGTFMGGNTFQVQISPAGGNFGPGTSVIGRGDTSPIACHIGLGTVPGLYRIRVVSSTPLPATFGDKSAYFEILPKPATPTSSSVSRCGGGTVNLVGQGCSNMRWFDASSRGNQLGSGTTFTTPFLTNNRTYFVGCVGENGCHSLRAPSTAVVNPLPAVTSMSPTTGNVNQSTVTLGGVGFSVLDSVVFPGGKRATVLSSTATSVQVRVPIGSTTGQIRVFTRCGSALSAQTFTPVVPTVSTPVPGVAPGTYSVAQNVALTCATAGAEIHYTLNGTQPVPGAPGTIRYQGTPIFVGSSLSLQAVAVFPGWTPSNLLVASYTISVPSTVATPVISPGTGSYTGGQLLTITCSTPQATIWYTTNGQVPVVGRSSTLRYWGPVTLIAPSVTVRAIAVRDGWTQSGVAVSFLTISGATSLQACTFNPPPGVYGGPQVVSISNPDPLASIYYTLDGTDPYIYFPLSRLYAGPLAIPATRTLKASAYRPGFGDSPRTTGVYTIAPTREAVENDPISGSETSGQLVVWPNPTGSVLHLDLPSEAGFQTARVYNASGMLVLTPELNEADPKLDVSPLPAGLYILRISGEKSGWLSRRFVKK